MPAIIGKREVGMPNWKTTLAALALASMPFSASAQEVTLDLWTIDDPGEYHYVLAKEFEAQNPGIRINVKTVQFRDMVNDLARAIATGDAPDITYIDNPDVALFSSRGLLLELNERIAQSGVIRTDDIFPGPRSAVTWEGGTYAIPRGSNTLALYYNADMFRAKGLDPDNPPRTWDELYETARTLTDPAASVYGLGFSAVGTEEGTFQFLPWVQMAGGDWNNLATEGGERALALWTRLVDERIASPDTLVRSQWDTTATFNSGNAAMVISGPWELPRMTKDAKFEFRAALLPVPQEGATRASALGEGTNAIIANSDNPDEAFRFLEFLYAQMPRVWNEFGYLPASAVETPDPSNPEIFAVFEESMKYARPRGPSPQWARISNAIHSAVQSAMTHQSDPKTALETAAATIETYAN